MIERKKTLQALYWGSMLVVKCRNTDDSSDVTQPLKMLKLSHIFLGKRLMIEMIEMIQMIQMLQTIQITAVCDLSICWLLNLRK